MKWIIIIGIAAIACFVISIYSERKERRERNSVYLSDEEAEHWRQSLIRREEQDYDID